MTTKSLAAKKKRPVQNQIITCYGQFWDRELVDWRGKQNRKREFKLAGRWGDRTIEIGEQIGVYVLYDDRYEPVYAGQVGRSKSKTDDLGVGGNTLFKRLKAHAVGEIGGRWRFFSWYGLKLINKDGKLREVSARKITVTNMIDALEAAMIASFEPRLNSQSGNLKSSKHIKQIADKTIASTTIESRLENIEKSLQKLVCAKKRVNHSDCKRDAWPLWAKQLSGQHIECAEARC